MRNQEGNLKEQTYGIRTYEIRADLTGASRKERIRKKRRITRENKHQKVCYFRQQGAEQENGDYQTSNG